jgi:hypothetical protein
MEDPSPKNMTLTMMNLSIDIPSMEPLQSPDFQRLLQVDLLATPPHHDVDPRFWPTVLNSPTSIRMFSQDLLDDLLALSPLVGVVDGVFMSPFCGAGRRSSESPHRHSSPRLSVDVERSPTTDSPPDVQQDSFTPLSLSKHKDEVKSEAKEFFLSLLESPTYSKKQPILTTSNMARQNDKTHPSSNTTLKPPFKKPRHAKNKKAGKWRPPTLLDSFRQHHEYRLACLRQHNDWYDKMFQTSNKLDNKVSKDSLHHAPPPFRDGAMNKGFQENPQVTRMSGAGHRNYVE